ncbi:MAG: VanZ family protein [Eubacterium sp.]
MERFFRSVYVNAESLIKGHLLLPLFLSLIILIIFLIYCRAKNKKAPKGKNISLFICVFYCSILFDLTLFSRIGTHQEPFSNIFGDWWIWDTDYILYVNFTPIKNIVMTLPMCFIFAFISKHFFGKDYNSKGLIAYSTLIAFLTSLFIEICQIIFALGTFQISDLVYNTLGGLLGALIYIGVKKIIRKKSHG